MWRQIHSGGQSLRYQGDDSGSQKGLQIYSTARRWNGCSHRPLSLHHLSKRKFDEAITLVRQKNPFPAITGRLCARPCEKVCRRGDVDQPIAIDLLKRFIAERENSPSSSFDNGGPGEFITPGPERKERVAIVGSGPTGLMAAYDLRRYGYSVTIFEALPLPGGTMAVGTGQFRLPEEVLNKG